MSPLPKIELHLHLEGALRPETVREMSQVRLGRTGPLEVGWERHYYTFTDFAGFMAQLTPRTPFRPDEYARVARECFEDQAARRAIYTEISFEPPVTVVGDDTRFWPVVEALEEERRRAELRFPIRIGFIAGLMRTLPVELAVYRVELAAQARDRGIGIAGIDLHGDEASGPPAEFLPAYRLAAECGLGLRAHAGEALGPESVWEALDVLGARRIGHGIRSVEDPELLSRLEQGDVTLEICPTSNVRTATVTDLPSHPIRLLYDLGVPVTVSSDDPLPFFTDIERECRLLVDELGFGIDDLRRIGIYAARAAFVSAEERATLAASIDQAYRTAAGEMTAAGPS
ncbi:MAG TPA: adenosine deaminase [Chloroflexota bacterium]|nr:adenosine deaminase [Chloroflexota bacterium]